MKIKGMWVSNIKVRKSGKRLDLSGSDELDFMMRY
jgi:hypothetical protein